MSLIHYIIYFGHFLLGINIILFFKSYRNQSIAFKIFTFYLLIILIIQLISTYLRMNKIENLFLSHYYFVGQFVLLSLFFKNIFKEAIFKNIILIIVAFILITLGVYYSIYPKDYYKFNTIEIIISSIPLIVYCFIFFLRRVEGVDKKFIYIISGLFLYLLCSTLLFTLGNFVNSSTSSFRKISWYSNALLYIVYQVLVFVEWYKHFRKKPLILSKE